MALLLSILPKNNDYRLNERLNKKIWYHKASIQKEMAFIFFKKTRNSMLRKHPLIENTVNHTIIRV